MSESLRPDRSTAATLLGQAAVFGLVTPCKVRHVYAGDRLSLQLADDAGHLMPDDDLTIQLPVRAQTVTRLGDPPLPALNLFDPHAADGHTSEAPGPCPVARSFVRRLCERAIFTVLHLPLPPRRGWLNSLCPGAIEIGELWLFFADWDNTQEKAEKADKSENAEASQPSPIESTAGRWVALSGRLVDAGLAHYPPTDAAG